MSAGKDLNLLDQRGWNLSGSFKKWTDVLDRLAAEMSGDQRSQPQEAAGRRGAEEQGFHQLLKDMDLHHPLCLSNSANEFDCAIAALAFNLLMVVKVFDPDEAHQSWTVPSLIRFWLTVPVRPGGHAYRLKVCIFLAQGRAALVEALSLRALPETQTGGRGQGSA